MEFYLSCQSGGFRGRTWRIDGGVYTIGRDPDCDVVLPDSSVSRAHCRISSEQRDLAVVDLGSVNGTWINGERLTSSVLHVGDELRLGSVILQLSTGSTGPIEAEVPSDDSTRSLADTDSYLLRDDITSLVKGDRPDTILDLANVCSIGRELSRAKTRPALLKSLVRNLRRYMEVGAVYLLLPGKEMEFTEEPLFASRDNDALGPAARERIVKTLFSQYENRRAVAEFHNDVNPPKTVIATPTMLGDIEAPVLVVEFNTNAGKAIEQVLDYVLAVGITVGPFLQSLERVEALREENHRLASRTVGKTMFVGSSMQASALLKEVLQVASTELNVLITGETGVGKEIVASILHENSGRHAQNFVVVNSPAISPELFASQMFGHRRGSFTGANADHRGYALHADGGTIFLDEVADLSMENQAKLLRFVETKTFTPVGSDESKSVDVRIVAATNARLPKLVAEGKFRSDLYHRLAAVHLSILPLRERPEDIADLANFFLNRALRVVKRPIRGITNEAMARLIAYPWPGNARELRNFVERAAAFAEGEWITERDVLERLELGSEQESALTQIAGDTPTLEEIQRRYVAFVFNACGGNGVKAGKILGLPKSTVYDRLRKYGILGARDPNP